MKFILAFSVCSWITGFCHNTMTIETKYTSWSECVAGGGLLIQDFAKDMKERVDEEKLYISYFCNEVPKDEKLILPKEKPSV